MKLRKTTAFIFACTVFFSIAGCGENSDSRENEIRVYTSFFGARGNDISDNNEIRQIIAEKTGAMCKETWLKEQEDLNTVFSDMMISNKYPDFIVPDSNNCRKLVTAGVFIPLDNYWDKYPNIKNFYSESEWNRVRSDDGHIYNIPLFSSCYQHDTETIHNDEAFWIQVKVLEWAGYPEIKTLDEYFNLIEEYIETNPKADDGEDYIGYEILANDTYFFSLDNPPMFLDGYPNDGNCIVDPETRIAYDYNLSPTAEKWFRKLNEEYKKGIIDPECFVLTSDQYYKKLSEGHILGIVDQNWNFNNAVQNLPSDCSYIPLSVTIDEKIQGQYHSITAFNDSTGLGITKSCTDIEGALQFLNDLLSPEILNLRFWGVEGVDYEVDKTGLFYHTEEQAERWRDKDYARKHICLYNYFPYYFGMNQDGINAYCPSVQPSEFYKTRPEDVRKCFDAYGVNTYVEMLNQASENPPWYPMWSYSPAENTSASEACQQIDHLKHQYLPRIVMSDNFDDMWAEYNKEYEKIDSQAYFDDLTAEVERRCKIAGQ
ncbi:MAG: sugar ABC transporter substrate-binding protein [Ruminococcus sp.]|nr:sugar ABC transporter substrate-binding protein [Ruminococcus sp.]